MNSMRCGSGNTFLSGVNILVDNTPVSNRSIAVRLKASLSALFSSHSIILITPSKSSGAVSIDGGASSTVRAN